MLRHAVFTALHSLAHTGIRASQQLLVSRFMWPGINKDVQQWTRQYLQCQYAKVHRHTVTPLSRFPAPQHTIQRKIFAGCKFRGFREF